jgi:NADH:ubiquinone oxidoreductase subunit K
MIIAMLVYLMWILFMIGIFALILRKTELGRPKPIRIIVRNRDLK